MSHAFRCISMDRKKFTVFMGSRERHYGCDFLIVRFATRHGPLQRGIVAEMLTIIIKVDRSIPIVTNALPHFTDVLS